MNEAKYKDKSAQQSYNFAQQCRADAEKTSGETRKSLLNIAQIYGETARIHEETDKIEAANRNKRQNLLARILGINFN